MRIADVMKKIGIIWSFVAITIIILEGSFILYQRRQIQRLVENEELQWFINYLRAELNMERKGLRYDDRGGDFCPACDGKNVAEIRYGYWKSGMWKEELAKQEIVLGGCVVGEYSKRFFCKDCGYKWGAINRTKNR